MRCLLAVMTLAAALGCGSKDATVPDAAAPVDVSAPADVVAPADVEAEDAAPVTDDTGPPVDTLDDVAPEEEDAAIPPTPLQATYELGPKAYPESVAFDPVTRVFFTSSLALGNVSRTTHDGVTTEFFAGNGEPDWLTLGIQVDAARRWVWVCAVYTTEMVRGEVWILDADSGERLATVDLEDAAPKGVCTDFALGSDGRAYVTDRQAGRLYEIPALAAGEKAEASVLVTDPQLAPEAIGQNGIVLSPDGNVLISEKYLPAKLMRIDLAGGGEVTPLAIDADLSAIGAGADALVAVGNTLYVSLDDRIAVVTLSDASWASAKLTAVVAIQLDKGATVSGFSGLTAAEGELYASRSDVILFAAKVDSTLPFTIQRVDMANVLPAP